MKETLTVRETAEMLGISPQAVRILMKRKKLDIGVTIPSLQGDQTRYIISRTKVLQLLGKESK